jgi:uncharacterized protein (DUF58 family)
MLDPETLRRIRRIELKTRRLVNDSFAGAYHSVFKGRGIVFDNVRPYQPGDDVRDIDWNVTARGDEAFIKQYAEERELTVMVVLDSSASCLFGTTSQSKRDLAAEVGAVLTLAAVRNNDKVGLLIFSDQVEHFVAPRKGRNHVLHVIRDLLAARPANRGTNLSLALQSINRFLKQRSIVFFMSDFMAAPEEYERDLMVTARRHDLVALLLTDPREVGWPDVGLVMVEDAETGMVRQIDTSPVNWRRQFTQGSQHFRLTRETILKQARVDRIDLNVEVDYVTALTEFFQRRRARR